jgi:asparagine synthase (glutamine-hydrolysing)
VCGIAGFASLDARSHPDDPDLVRMVAQLRHRGPDAFGYHTEPGVGFAHARLSIIDLAGGAQPIRNEDGRVWVTFNGEIFNYVELRRDLEGAGHVFYTKTDTEVLVHAYEEYGSEFVHHLNGQFALGIWDGRERKLILARDRAGILPLFYTERNGRLLFASEIKALLAETGAPERLSARALDQVLTFWSPLSPHTMFPGIFEVSPGQIVIVQNGVVRTHQYWDWEFPRDGEHLDGKTEDLAEELRALLIDATRLRLRSDVPVGAYLSGGLDSSVLTTIIRQYTDTPLRTFSIGFDDPALDESGYQRALISHLNADHSAIQCSNADVAAGFATAVNHAETVLVRAAVVPMMRLSGLVRAQGYRVVLTGEGSDEVLGGYDLFKEAKVRQFWARERSSRMRPALLQRLYPYLDFSPSRTRGFSEAFFGMGLDAPQAPFFSHLPRWTTTARCKEFFSPNLENDLRVTAIEQFERVLPASFGRWHWFNRAQYIESRSLMAGYLLCSQGDRMLMANSVEGRFPFLDHRVIEFARKLRPTLLMRGLNEKYLLKKAMGRELPAAIVERPKQPYRAPGVPAFFAGAWQEDVRSLLGESAIRNYGYFDPTRVQRLVQKIETGRPTGEKDNMALIAILSTQLLHREFIETKASSSSEVTSRHAGADTTVYSS